MISENSVKTLIELLSAEDKHTLKVSIEETYGSDISTKIDRNPSIQASLNQFIYSYVKGKHPELAEKVLFDANELPEDIKIEKQIASDTPKIKSYVSISSTNPEIALNNLADQKLVVEEQDQSYNYNVILDGRTKSTMMFESLFSGLDEKSREIIIRGLLYLSVFITLICTALTIMNTLHINQIQALYGQEQVNFLYQYAHVCQIDVKFAKSNACVIGEINKKITELSNGRFWYGAGIFIFGLISAFFFYYMSTYRQYRDAS